jgi:uncharacterized membrane protein
VKVDRAELWVGLAETRRYLLSHHVPGERYRCYAPVVFGRRVHLCARCSGVYPGIVAGLFALLVAPAVPATLLLIAVLPLPALVDWALTSLTGRRGYNAVRTATGLLLGYGYGLGLRHLLAGDWTVLVVGVGYAAAAGLLVAADRRRCVFDLPP